MSIITKESKGSPLDATDVNNNFKYVRDVLAALGLELKDYETLTGDIWNLSEGSNFRKLELTGDTNLFTEGGVSTGIYILDVKQPANGGKKLTIDGNPIVIRPLEVSTVVVTFGGFGKKYNSDVNPADLAPRITSQSSSITTILDDAVKFFLRGVNIKKVRVYKDSELIKEKVTPAVQFRMSKETEGVYQFELESADGQTIWSDEMNAVLADAAPAEIIRDPQSVTVDAGTEATLTVGIAGAPTPRVEWFELVNGSKVPTGKFGEEFKVVSLFTKTYVAVASNQYKTEVIDVPAIMSEDGLTEITPATYKTVLKTFSDESLPAIVTPKKMSQAAPTNEVMDDNKDLFGWTNPAGITTDKIEYSINGSAPVKATKNPLPVPDADLPVGSVMVRVAETDTHHASEWLSNTTAFYSSIQPRHIDAPPAVLANVVANGVDYTTTAGAVVRNNYITYPTKKIPADFAGAYLQTDVIIDTNCEYAFIGVKKTNEVGDYATMLAAFYLTQVGGFVYVRTITNGVDGTADVSEGLVPGGKLRMIRAGLNAFELRYSTDNFASFTKIHTFSVDGSGDLFLICAILAGKTLKNPFEYGFKTIA